MPIVTTLLRIPHPLSARTPHMSACARNSFTIMIRVLVKGVNENAQIIPAWLPMYHPSSAATLRLMGLHPMNEMVSRITGDKIGKRVMNDTPAHHGYFPATLLHSLIHSVPPGDDSVPTYYQTYLATSALDAKAGVLKHEAAIA